MTERSPPLAADEPRRFTSRFFVTGTGTRHAGRSTSLLPSSACSSSRSARPRRRAPRRRSTAPCAGSPTTCRAGRRRSSTRLRRRLGLRAGAWSSPSCSPLPGAAGCRSLSCSPSGARVGGAVVASYLAGAGPARPRPRTGPQRLTARLPDPPGRGGRPRCCWCCDRSWCSPPPASTWRSSPSSAWPPGRSGSPGRPTCLGALRDRHRRRRRDPRRARLPGRSPRRSLRSREPRADGDPVDRAPARRPPAVGRPHPVRGLRRRATAADQGLRTRRHRRSAGRPLVANADLPRPDAPRRHPAPAGRARGAGDDPGRAGRRRRDDVVAAAESSGDAVLVLGRSGAARRRSPRHRGRTLRRVWAAVGALHDAGLAPRRADARPHRAADGAGPVFSEFADGAVAADEAQRAQEVAILLASQALAVGPDRAVDAALAGIGAERVAAAQPYLQRAALPRSLRSGKGIKAAIPALAPRSPTAPAPSRRRRPRSSG